MSENEMAQEIERLREELAEMTKSRDRLCTWLCQAMRLAPMTNEELEEMRDRPGKDVQELLRDLMPPEMHDLIDDPIDAQRTENVSVSV